MARRSCKALIILLCSPSISAVEGDIDGEARRDERERDNDAVDSSGGEL